MNNKAMPIVRQGLTVLFGICLLLGSNKALSRELSVFKDGSGVAGVPARVTQVTHRELQSSDLGMEMWIVYFEGVVTGGEHKGLTIEAQQIEDPIFMAPMKEVEAGDKVLLYELYKGDDGVTTWVMQEYMRSDTLLLLAVFFALLLLVFGRWKGLFTVVSLALTCMAIFAVLVPAILGGYDIYLSTGGVCVFIILMTLALVNGYNRKSLAAGAGCVGGLAASGLLLFIANLSLRLTGFVDEEAAYLTLINPENPLDLKAVVFCSIILGALGAALDVSVSIASSLSEIAETVGEPMSFTAVLGSGMNIGRDIMGTMANTLVLAYIGSSMSLVLLLIVYSNSLLELFNREVVVVEILQSLVGSIGLLVTIPITSVCWALLHGCLRRGETKKVETEGE